MDKDQRTRHSLCMEWSGVGKKEPQFRWGLASPLGSLLPPLMHDPSLPYSESLFGTVVLSHD